MSCCFRGRLWYPTILRSLHSSFSSAIWYQHSQTLTIRSSQGQPVHTQGQGPDCWRDCKELRPSSSKEVVLSKSAMYHDAGEPFQVTRKILGLGGCSITQQLKLLQGGACRRLGLVSPANKRRRKTRCHSEDLSGSWPTDSSSYLTLPPDLVGGFC